MVYCAQRLLTAVEVMGGMLADPAENMPGLFGEGALFGFQWIRDYPYCLPSLVNVFTLSFATAVTFLFLEEVSFLIPLLPTKGTALLTTTRPRKSAREGLI